MHFGPAGLLNAGPERARKDRWAAADPTGRNGMDKQPVPWI